MAPPQDLASVAPGEGPLDELLAALMQAGEVESDGAFTLDRDKARQKMQRFQLAEPARYVLELVQAAVLRGARQISVEIDQDDLHLRCDANPFSLRDFEQIYDALFIRSRSDQRQALRHLALGASTALSMKPAWVRVESGGAGGAFLELYKGDKERMGKTKQAAGGLHVHVRQRGRLGVLWRLLGYAEHRQAEFVMLREHCGLSMVPIEINGLPITVGYQLPGTMFWMTFQHGNTRGVVGVMGNLSLLSHGSALPAGYPFGLHSTMHLMRNCVAFEIDKPPLLLPGFGTLVESPSFHLDISHQRVVRNQNYEEAVRLVLAQQIQLLIRECRRLSSGERSLPPHMLEGLLLALLSRLGSIDPLLRWAGRADTGPGQTPRGFPEAVPGAEALLAARLFRTPQDQRVSLDEVIAELRTFGTVAVATVRSTGVDLDRKAVLLLADSTRAEVFANLFPGCLEDRNVASQAAHERAKNLARWRKRKQEPRLTFPAYLARTYVQKGGLRGEIGIRGADDDPLAAPEQVLPSSGELRLTLLHQGGVLVEKRLASSLSRLHAVLAGEFSPNYAWDDVLPDDKLAAALRALLSALPELAEQLLAAPEKALLQSKRLRALREIVLLSRSATAQAALAQKLGLAPEKPEQLAPQSPVSLDGLGSVPLFESLSGESLTVDQLVAHWHQHGYVAAVDPAAGRGVSRETRAQWTKLLGSGRNLQRAWQRARPVRPDSTPEELAEAALEAAPIPEFVVWQSAAPGVLREVLDELIPAERIWDAAPWLSAVARHMQELVAQEQEQALPMSVRCAITVDLEGSQGPLGTLGLLAKPRWHRSQDLVEVALPDFPEPVLRYGVPGGGMLAVQLAPSAPAAAGQGAAARPPDVEGVLRRSLYAALPALAAALLGRPEPEVASHRHSFLLALATAIFPTALLRMNYERLHAHAARTGHAQQDAESEHAAILDLVMAYSAQQVDKVMQRLMQQRPDEPVRAAAIHAALFGDAASTRSPAATFVASLSPVYPKGAAAELLAVLFPETEGLSFEQRALRPHPRLREAPLFRSLAGEPLPLGCILDACAQYGELLYAAAGAEAEPARPAEPSPEVRPDVPSDAPADASPNALADVRPVVQVGEDAMGLALYCLLGEERLQVYQPGLLDAHPELRSRAASAAAAFKPAAAPKPSADPPADPPPSRHSPAPLPRDLLAERVRPAEEDRFLKALLDEIAAVVGSEHKLLTRINLERIRIAESDWPLAVICTEFATLLNRKNAAMKRALREAAQDPACMWFVVSAVYTALNVFFEEVTDDDEAQFLTLLSRRAISALSRSAAT